MENDQSQMPQIPETPAPPPTPKKSKKGLILTIAGLILVLLIGVGIGYLLFTKAMPKAQKDTSQKSVEEAPVVQKTPDLTPEDVITKIKSTYAAKYTLLDLEKNNQPKEGEMSVRLSQESPAYKAEGYNFYTSYDGGSTLMMMLYDPSTDYELPTEGDTTLRTEIAGIYVDFGLEKKESRSNTGDNIDVYLGKGLICTIESPSAPASGSGASCGSIEAYSAAAAKAKPFVDILPDATSSTIISGLKISDSKVSDYQTAQASIGSVGGFGGYAALYYKKDPGAWKFFTGTQQTLLCSSYNTTDLRNAYKGERCYVDSTHEGTVK